jgi:hypothetical protein
MTLPHFRRLLSVLTLVLFLTSIRVEASLIDGQPQIKIVNGVAEISFSVTEFTDVTVEVVNQQDQVLRHLASGLLGPNAPQPFQTNSKFQLITWDLKDNKGALVDPKAVKILVRAGLKPSFERVFGQSGQSLGVIRGLCVDKEGSLFVTMESMPTTYREHTFTKVFDREGNYLRTILPHPANLSASELPGIQFADVSPDRKVPFLRSIWHRETNLLELDFHQPVATKDGKILFPNHKAVSGGGGTTVVSSIGTNGSVGINFYGQPIARFEAPYTTPFKNKVFPRVYLAASPDDRYIYASGVTRSYDPPAVSGSNVAGFDNCIYRIDRTSTNAAVPFIGTKFSTTGALSNPLGVDVDDEGNIYVCDYKHNRIAIFNSEGVLLNELPIERPIQVGVHASGKIYVYSADPFPAGANPNTTKLTHRLFRLAGKTDATKELTIEWPDISSWNQPVMALDKTSTQPAIWMGSFSGFGNYFWAKGDIKKIIDNGTTFQDLGNVIAAKMPEPDLGRSHKFITVDPETDEVWWDYFVFDGKTGNLIRKFKGAGTGSAYIGSPGTFIGEPKLGPNNSVIVYGAGGHSLERFKRDGTAYKFSSTNTHKLTLPFTAGARNYSRGVDVDDNGNIFVVGYNSFSTKKNENYVWKYNENGTVGQTNVIYVNESMSGIAVDRKGALYVTSHLKDYGHKLTLPWEAFFGTIGNSTYEQSTGKVLKFTSAGGDVRLDPAGTDFQSSRGRDIPRYKANGVQWTKDAISEGGDGCSCEVTDIDVDRHNRVFVPDPLTYSIWVYDENGNPISRFGEYGNMDSAGPNSRIPVPEIPLAYAFRLAVSDKAVYINDTHAQRVMKVRLDYAETVELSADGTVPPDTTPPSISVTSPADFSYVTNNTVTLVGTASDSSGILSVKVNGSNVLSSNHFSNWSFTDSSLVSGTNQFTIVAIDQASPGNIKTIKHCIINLSEGFDGNGDGIADLWQLQNFGVGFATDPLAQSQADVDGDGMTNMQEYAAETNPRDRMSGLRLWSETPAPSENVLTLHWTSVLGKSYTVEFSSNLLNWSSVSFPIVASSSTTSWSDDGSATGSSPVTQIRRFYRIKTSSP